MKQNEAKLDSFHRDLRLVGDLSMALSSRLEALEDAMANDLARTHDALSQGAEAAGS